MNRLIVALTFALSAAQAVAGTMYQWTDERGGVQYGQYPPADRPFQRVEIRPAPSPGAPVPPTTSTQPSQPPAATGAEGQASQSQQQQFSQADCEKLSSNLETLTSNPRLSRRNAAGEMERITEEERQTMITQTRQDLETYCP